jgi:hypothetical protein
MLKYTLFFAGGFIAIYSLRLFRAKLYALALDSASLLNALLSTEDDDTKLTQLEASSSKALTSLLIGVLLIAMAGAIVALAVFAVGLTSGDSTIGVWDLISLSVGASIPFFLPLKRTPSQYSELSVLLHRMILDNYNLGMRLLRWELKNTRRRRILDKSEFVVVTGLARAGTTSMMNKLAELPIFSSLTYAQMPFLLSPQLWKRVYNPKRGESKERSHGDGIVVNFRSAEALEEYFFKVKSSDSYIGEQTLEEYAISEEDYKTYLSYQACIRNRNDRVYLAKNNNFLLRYFSVRQYNPDFLMIVLFRHPLYHAASLLEKHRSYLQMQESDPFVLEYMNWLGHHEFGENHKPFAFNNQELPQGDTLRLDYWLDVWVNHYQYALSIQDSRVLFIPIALSSFSGE